MSLRRLSLQAALLVAAEMAEHRRVLEAQRDANRAKPRKLTKAEKKAAKRARRQDKP